MWVGRFFRGFVDFALTFGRIADKKRPTCEFVCAGSVPAETEEEKKTMSFIRNHIEMRSERAVSLGQTSARGLVSGSDLRKPWAIGNASTAGVSDHTQCAFVALRERAERHTRRGIWWGSV